LLPPFDDRGNLPSGIHSCDTDELVTRFGSGSPEREIETQELLDFIAWARTSGIHRLIINGSYVTAKSAPNDVDIVILPGPNYPRDEPPFDEQGSRWPFLQILIAVDEADLEEWSLQDFGTDRIGNYKGVIEVTL
jgi:hypothetical protein